MIWFTSDTHFGHENMLRLADRPWPTLAQMNDAMVASVNSKVAVDDEQIERDLEVYKREVVIR